jgi:hypothetical protein
LREIRSGFVFTMKGQKGRLDFVDSTPASREALRLKQAELETM